MITFILSILIIFLLYNFIQPPKEIAHLPSVSTLTLIKDIFKIQPVNLFESDEYQKIANKYGIIRIWSFMQWNVVITDIKAIKQILKDPDAYPKALLGDSMPHSFSKQLYGTNLSASNGKVWKNHLIATNRFFCKKLDFQLLDEPIQQFILKIKETNNEKINIEELVNVLTIEMYFKSIYCDIQHFVNPLTFKKKFLNAHLNSLSALNFLFPTIDFKGLPMYRQVREDINWFKTILKSIIQSNNEESLISTLLNSTKNKALNYNEHDVINNFMGLFFAGTSPTLNTIILEIQSEARKEIKVESDIKKMKYLKCIVKESLRMLPPFFLIYPRISKENIQVGDFTIPKNTNININVSYYSHNPVYFKDPYTFNPNRHMTRQEDLAFGYGRRKCIGQLWVMDQILYFLCKFLPIFEIDVPKEVDIKDYVVEHVELQLKPFDFIFKYIE